MKKISSKIFINPYTLISLAVFIFYGRLLLGSMLYTGDIFAYQFPEKFMIRESLLNGNLPFINPYILSGSPMLNNIAVAALYPLNLLLIIGSPVFGFNLFIFTHLLLAGFSIYIFLSKGLGINRNLSCLGGVSYALSGPIWGSIDKGFIASAWLIPLFFMGILKLFREGEISNKKFYRSPLILPVSSLALLFYCGNFMEAYFALITGGLGIILYSIFLSRDSKPAHESQKEVKIQNIIHLKLIIKRISVYCLVVFTAILIASPQILPTYLASNHSYRTGGLTLAEAQHWSLPPVRILEFFVPFSFGTRAETGFKFGGASYKALSILKREGSSPWFDSIFFGIPLLCGVFLAIFAVFKSIIEKRRLDKQTKISLFLFIVALIFFFLAIGKYFPFYKILHYILPGFNFFRHPEKFMEWVNLFLIILGVYGIDKFCISKGKKGLKDFSKTVYATVVMLFIFMIPTLFSLFSQSDTMKDITRWQLIMIFLSILTAGFTLLSINLLGSKIKSLIFFLIAITSIHLIILSFMTQWTISQKEFEKTKVWTDSLPDFDKSQWRVFTSGTIDYSGEKYLTKDFRKQKLQEYINLNTNAPVLKKIRTPEGFDALAEQKYVEYFNLQKHPGKRLLDILSVKYIGSGLPIEGRIPRFFNRIENQKGFRYKGTMILKNPDALPRISAYRSYIIPEKGKEEELIFRAKRNMKEAFVLEKLPINFAPGDSCSKNPSLKVAVDLPGKINIEVINGPTWIVVRDWHSAGWVCKNEEGKILPIVTADGGLMSVFADKGSQKIKFSFVPPGFYAGLISACAGLFLLVLSTVLKRETVINFQPVMK